MKAESVIKQLQSVLPSVTDLFTDNIVISSLTYAGGIVTAITASAHGLETNDYSNVIGSTNPISNASITRTGNIAVCKTSADHDLTLGPVDIKYGGKKVNLTGSNEAEFNGEFNLRRVVNRREYEIDVDDSGPLVATGSPLIQDGSQSPGFNGRHQVTKIDATTFSYPISTALFASAGGTPIAKPDARISGAVSFDIAELAYTKQNANELWAFVVLGDVIASKNRETRSDLNETNKKNTGIRQRVSQPFTVYVFAPSIDDIAGRNSRDLMEDVSIAMFKSLIGVKFETGYFSGNQYVSTFINHGFTDYNSAYYVHEFNFELAADLTFEDTTGYEFDTAFRDATIQINPDFGTQEDPATVSVDLDEEVLP